MAQEFEIINANSLPAATNITDNDMILIIQGSGPKRALPSAMKGKPGDPGLSVYLGVTSANIQWKQGATGVWQNLIELEKIRGPKGEKPLFRKVGGTLQMKYEGQPDTAYVSLFDREELKMKFSDLTAAEVDKLKLHFSDLTNADKAELMKPATDAATEVRQEMVQISTKAGQVIEATNTAKNNAEKATTAANQAASAATTAAGLANTAVEETETATGLALSAATLAEEKAGLANTAAQGATKAKENAETATTEATEAALAADTAAGLATTAATDATAAKDAAVLAARNAQEAADNVQDGKTPQLGIGTVESGSEASATVAAAGSDESGNPKYTLSFVLPQGEEGKAPVIEVGTITTGEPGTGASAELVSNGQTTEGNPKYLFNLSVPRGNQGLPGTGSGNVLVSENGLVAGKKYLFVPSEDGRSEGTFIEYIAPDIPEAQVQPDWNSTEGKGAILNKPTSMPASDVQSWAKAATKPAYTAAEVGAAPSNHNHDGVYQPKGSYAASDHNHAGVYEPSFTKGTAFNKNFGTAAGTVCQGNDSRLNDARPASDVSAWAKAATKPAYTAAEVGASPSNHNHSGVYEPVFSKNTAFNKGFGTASGTVCEGNDSRLSDRRNPISNSIPGSANLNSYTGVGMYFCPANATVATLINCPTTNAFFMEVGQHAGTYQRLVEYVTVSPRVWFRNSYNGTWGSWYQEYNSSTPQSSVSGNAGTSTKLQTSRTINGVVFDGTANITISAAASDVYAWAKAATKPAYTYTEVGAASSGHNHSGIYEPVFSKGTAFNKNFGTAAGTVCDGGDSRLSNARPASDVYVWAKAATKPAYTAAEVGAAAVSHSHGDATTGASGFMPASDKQKVNRLRNYITSTTVTGLNVDAEIVYVTLSANASLSASAVGAAYNGRTITAYVYCSVACTITIPTTGSYLSMCGSSVSVAAGKWIEFDLTCVGGVWHIAKMEQE